MKTLDSIALSPTQIVASIQSTWEKWLLREARPGTPHPYVYASAWTPCERQMVYEMRNGDLRPQWTAQQLANFQRGKDREITLRSILTRIGPLNDPPFDLVGAEERFELRGRNGKVVIVGKVDATFDFGKGLRPKAEFKNWNSNMTERIDTFYDVMNGSPFTRYGGFQTLAYLYGSGEPLGIMVLDRPGIPKLIPVLLEDYYDEMEQFLSRAENAQYHLEKGTLPDYIKDATVCKRCWCFGGLCSPPISTGPGVKVLDAEWEPKLERRHELEAAYREYSALDKELKASHRGLESGVVGSFVLSGKWGKQTSYELPDDVKEKYKKVDPKGKFTLTVEKMP